MKPPETLPARALAVFWGVFVAAIIVVAVLALLPPPEPEEPHVPPPPLFAFSSSPQNFSGHDSFDGTLHGTASPGSIEFSVYFSYSSGEGLSVFGATLSGPEGLNVTWWDLNSRDGSVSTFDLNVSNYMAFLYPGESAWIRVRINFSATYWETIQRGSMRTWLFTFPSSDLPSGVLLPLKITKGDWP